VDAAAVRIKTADDHVVDADERGKDAHERDEPERGVPGDGEGETDDVGFACAPVAVKNRGCARHIHVARTLNGSWYQFFDSKRGSTRASRRLTFTGAGSLRLPCPLMMPTRLAVGLEPLNALDAAHRSPRSAPHSRAEFGSPVGLATRPVH